MLLEKVCKGVLNRNKKKQKQKGKEVKLVKIRSYSNGVYSSLLVFFIIYIYVTQMVLHWLMQRLIQFVKYNMYLQKRTGSV